MTWGHTHTNRMDHPVLLLPIFCRAGENSWTLIRQKLRPSTIILPEFIHKKKFFPEKKPSDEVYYNRLHFSRATATTAFIVSSFHNFCKAYSIHKTIQSSMLLLQDRQKYPPDFFLYLGSILYWTCGAIWTGYSVAMIYCFEWNGRLGTMLLPSSVYNTACVFPLFSLLLSIIAEKCFIKKVPHFRLSKLVA